jgi:predicted fused transcriptional regulator/phosphomethylpyrimidine kinase
MSWKAQTVAVLLGFVMTAAFAQSVTTTAGRLQDLNYIANTLPQLDHNFFYQLDSATYQQAVAAMQARITTPADSEFYAGLEQLAAMSNDMHAGLG